MSESFFFQDLAVMMAVVGLVSVIFTRLGWPKVIGYLLAGILMSEHTWGGSFLADPKSIGTIGQLGIVFLMFTLGLEFSADDMKKVKHVTVPTAIFDTLMMIWLGYTVGTHMLGWGSVESLFLGAALCDSATTLLAKTIEEMRWGDRPFVRYIFGTTIFEDILCVGVIALVTGVAQGRGMTFLAVFAIYIGVAYAKVEIDHLFPWLVMQLGAPLYVGLWGGMNVLMMGNGQGFEHCYPFILVMTSCWLCDTVAYFFGKFAAGKGPFGRHLFAPSISPKKTWEGSVAGSIATIAWVAYWVKCSASLSSFEMNFTWTSAIVIGLLITVAGQVGDLLMSALKRWSGTKDSGNLFVGHGGVLDRCDSFLLAAPALYLVLDFLQKLA